MALEPIGDIANPSLTDNTVVEETLTWETESDWDNAVAESYAYHPAGTLQMAISPDDMEDYTDGATNPGHWKGLGDSAIVYTNSAYSGSKALGISSSYGEQAFHSNDWQAAPYSVVEFKYWETSSNSITGFRYDDANGNELFGAYTDNPQVTYVTGNGTQTFPSPSPDYGEWRKFRFEIDWANNQVDIYWEDLTGSTSSASALGEPFVNNGSEIGDIIGTAEYSGNWASNEGLVDDVVAGYHTSNLTTATKSMSADKQPDLTNLSYNLNSQSITLNVIGSPGTASEETVSQSLDGATSYSLSWTGSHTDFRIKPVMTSGDYVTTPTVSSVSLTG